MDLSDDAPPPSMTSHCYNVALVYEAWPSATKDPGNLFVLYMLSRVHPLTH